VQNIAVETDPAGNIKLSKRVSTERIDGAAALVNAIDRLDRHQVAPPPPSYQVLVFGG
jgi:phage terminase large subunit-like protein